MRGRFSRNGADPPSLDLAVVGGGPAGFMAALAAAGRGEGASIAILEPGVPLAKVMVSGGGRCNLTHTASSPEEMAAAYPRGGSFLLPSLSAFGPRQTMAWFEAKGVPLVVEEGGRVFPRSGLAQTVRDCLLREAAILGIGIRQGVEVREIRARRDGFALDTSRGELAARRVVLATGGMKGAAGRSGLHLAVALGHRVVPPRPSLCGLFTPDFARDRLAGVTLADVALTATVDGVEVARTRGGLIFTHRGLSGPAVLDLSSLVARRDFGRERPLEVRLDLLPGTASADTDTLLDTLLASHPRRTMANLPLPLARALVLAVMTRAGLDPGLKTASLSRRGANRLAQTLRAFSCRITGRDTVAAMVTAGGVSLDQVDPLTMTSRLIPGLFLCGEVLDVDGPTGGYNLQAAWSTGQLLGSGLEMSGGGV
jgi:hypothetical protein